MAFFFFNDTATTEIYTLSLHDALPISIDSNKLDALMFPGWNVSSLAARPGFPQIVDRKSTRLNSSHSQISYAVFCLKKKNRHNDAHVDDCPLLAALLPSSLRGSRHRRH